jgi:hypothetical protein
VGKSLGKSSLGRLRIRDNEYGLKEDWLKVLKVNGTGSRLCPMVGFGINGKPSGSAITVLV